MSVQYGRAPDPECFIIPGSLAQLFIAADGDEGSYVPATHLSDPPYNWIELSDLDNHTVAFPNTDTALNSGGWIRSLVMERGFTVTSTGRLSTLNPGQVLVNQLSSVVGCPSLGLFRFRVPGAHEEDPPGMDLGFWSWPSRQDSGAASNDAFTWGVALAAYQPPVTLINGQFPATAAGGSGRISVTGYRHGLPEAEQKVYEQMLRAQHPDPPPEPKNHHKSEAA